MGKLRAVQRQISLGGEALHLEPRLLPPGLARCEHCLGEGVVPGLRSDHLCEVCNGKGRWRKEVKSKRPVDWKRVEVLASTW